MINLDDIGRSAIEMRKAQKAFSAAIEKYDKGGRDKRQSYEIERLQLLYASLGFQALCDQYMDEHAGNKSSGPQAAMTTIQITIEPHDTCDRQFCTRKGAGYVLTHAGALYLCSEHMPLSEQPAGAGSKED